MPPKRKHKFGYEKREKKRKEEEFNISQRGSLDKFVVKEPRVHIDENQNIDNVNVEIPENVVIDENVGIENQNFDHENVGDVPIEDDNVDNQNVTPENGDDNLNNSIHNEDDNKEDNGNDKCRAHKPI